MILAKINEFTIHVPDSGGKAGKGCNVTSSLQVRHGSCIVKQFRFKLFEPKSRLKAIAKAKAFCEGPTP